MFKPLMIVACLAILVPGGRAQAQETTTITLSLAEAEAMAWENNPAVRAAVLDLEYSMARRTQASHARFLPEFSLTDLVAPAPRLRGEFTPSGVLTSPDTNSGLSDLRLFTQVDVNLVQPLWTFGKLSGLNNAASYAVDADRANLQTERASARLQVHRLYWGVLLGQELLGVVESSLSEVERADSVLQAKFDEGSDAVTQTDMFKFQIFQYEINKKHREAVDKLELARSALRATLGMERSTDFVLDAAHLDPVEADVASLQTYMETAHRRRPELSRLRAGMDATQAMIGVARSEYLPQLFLAGQIKYNYAPDRFDPRNPFVYNPTNFFRPGIALGLKWNLNFVQTRDRTRLATAQFNQLAEQEPAVFAGINLEVESAYLKVVRTRRNMTESRRALRASNNWYRSEAQTFDLGVGEVKDLIDAFRAKAAMNAEHLQNIFEFNTAVAELSRAAGQDLSRNE